MMKSKTLLILVCLGMTACRGPLREPSSPQATPDTRTAAAEINKRVSISLPSQSRNKQPSTGSKKSLTSTFKPIKIKFSELFTSSWYELKFTEIEFTDRLVSDNPLVPSPKKDHIFMFFKATVKNIDEKQEERSFTIISDNPRLVIDDGTEIKFYPSYIYQDGFLSGKIPHGEILEGTFGFEVKKSLKKATLKIDPLGEKRKISIKIDGPAKHLSQEE